jgi:hypothetical protein
MARQWVTRPGSTQQGWFGGYGSSSNSTFDSAWSEAWDALLKEVLRNSGLARLDKLRCLDMSGCAAVGFSQETWECLAQVLAACAAHERAGVDASTGSLCVLAPLRSFAAGSRTHAYTSAHAGVTLTLLAGMRRLARPGTLRLALCGGACRVSGWYTLERSKGM